MAAPIAQPGPVAGRDRADVLDALRGFALLGILISHMPDFSGHSFMTPHQQSALDRFGVDSPLAALQDFLIRGKFYSLFSLLFGIGFAIQLESASRRKAGFVAHFARRLFILLLIGLVHASLWYGDILKDYALIGFVLILTRHAGARTLAVVTVLVFFLRLAWPVFMFRLLPVIWTTPGTSDPGGQFSNLTQAFDSSMLSTIALANVTLVKLKVLQMVYDGRVLSILAMFLLGALVGKLRLYRNVEMHRALFGRIFAVCAPIGVVGNAALTPIHMATAEFPPTPMWVFENGLYAVVVPAMAVAYASGFAWLWSGLWRHMLRGFAPAGQTALTTYLSQTLIGITLFYGIGFGLRGHMGLAEGTILGLSIFVMQGIVSSIWLYWFAFGPVEWIWRRATYGVPIAMLREAQR